MNLLVGLCLDLQGELTLDAFAGLEGEAEEVIKKPWVVLF